MLSPCSQLTCSGMIDGGFCNVCGLADSGQGSGATNKLVSVRLTALASNSPSKTASKPKRENYEVHLVEPTVPPEKRFCNKCSERVKEEQGLCGNCGQGYSFIPTLKPGDIVAEQFEVIGTLAYGGLGWIYLGRDLALSRPVVLKGLLDSHDASSAAVAVAERQFLASVKHPNIVSVYSFVSRGAEGFIVMEYVPGRTLRDIRKERGPLPPTEAIPYILGILGAFAYLHGQEPPLIYCDFKPENCMLDGEEVKLIDLGGVRRANDLGGDIYGTIGFAAPEASDLPTPSSDLFSVARTLAVLILDFKGFQGLYKESMPWPADHPILETYDSLYRFLLKATHLNPKRRFADADEMADQLAGIYQETLAVERGDVRQRESRLFSPDPLLYLGPEIDVEDLLLEPRDQSVLPVPKLDPRDPAAPTLMSLSAIPDTSRKLAALAVACHKYPKSLHAPLHLMLTTMENVRVGSSLDAYLPALKDHWLGDWIRGCRAIKDKLCNDPPASTTPEAEQIEEAQRAFQCVYTEFPGETATKFGMAISLEIESEFAKAIPLYERITRIDNSFPSAVFGLARCQIHLGDYPAAAKTLTLIQPTSFLFQRAQMARIQCLLNDEQPNFDKVIEAGRAAEGLRLDEVAGRKLTRDIQSLAYNLCRSGVVPPVGSHLLNSRLSEHQLRVDIEANLRHLARLTHNPRERLEYISQANSIRPFTLF